MKKIISAVFYIAHALCGLAMILFALDQKAVVSPNIIPNFIFALGLLWLLTSISKLLLSSKHRLFIQILKYMWIAAAFLWTAFISYIVIRADGSRGWYMAVFLSAAVYMSCGLALVVLSKKLPFISLIAASHRSSDTAYSFPPLANKIFYISLFLMVAVSIGLAVNREHPESETRALLSKVLSEEVEGMRKNNKYVEGQIFSAVEDPWGNKIRISRSIPAAEKKSESEKRYAGITVRSFGPDGREKSQDDMFLHNSMRYYDEVSEGVYTVNPGICDEHTEAQEVMLSAMARSVGSGFFSKDECKRIYSKLRDKPRLSMRFASNSEEKATDLSPLKDLVHLNELIIKGAEVSDLSQLRKLKKLTRLEVESSRLTDIRDLEGLNKLVTLDLSRTQISDLTPLKNLTELVNLEIESDRLTDISDLKGLTKLDRLILKDTKVSNIEPLEGLKNLTKLEIESTELVDIGALRGLKKLERLSLGKTGIGDIGSLIALENLSTLQVESDRLTDVSALKELARLRKIVLNGTQITDFSSLKSMPELYELEVNGAQITDLTALRRSAKFAGEPLVLVGYRSSSSGDYQTFYAPVSHYYIGGDSLFRKPGSKVWLYERDERRKVSIKNYHAEGDCHKITIDELNSSMPVGVVLLTEEELPAQSPSGGPTVTEDIYTAGLEIFRSESSKSEGCPWFKPNMH